MTTFLLAHADLIAMATWRFLTNHARVVLILADQPEVRLADLALALDVSERSASAIVSDLTASGHVVKERVGRRNRYLIVEQLPLLDTVGPRPTLGDLLRLFARD